MAANPVPWNHLRIRRSVRELEKMPKELNAFLRAWKRIKALPPDNPNSFWAIAGYHGEPFKPRQNHPDAQGWGGWCQHANVLFPTWHRFYLLRLEQALRTVCPEDDVTMAYWDETSDESLEHGIPRTLTDATVMIDGKQEPNPLTSFSFPEQIGTPQGDEFYEKPKGYETVRYPWSGIKCPPEAKEQADKHNEKVTKMTKMTKILPNPTELLNRNIVYWLNRGKPREYQANSIHSQYKKCLEQISYNTFSNTHSASQTKSVSIEQPHNDIHLAVGGFDTPIGDKDPPRKAGIILGANGDMGENETAAFDPIFFFHHCNIDRVFWIWQKIHGYTDSFDIIPGDPGTNPSDEPHGGQGPTPDQSPDQVLTMDTPLSPFQHPNGLPVNSKDCINIETQLGFTYSKGSLEHDVYRHPDAPKRRLPAQFHEVSKLADIHPILAEADQAVQYSRKYVFDVTNVDDWHEGEGAATTGGRFEWTSNHKIGVRKIDRDKYPGSFLIRAYYKQIDPQHFVGQVGVLDRWNRKKCANCQFHRYTATSFDLEEFILTWPPKVNSDFKIQVVYKDPMKGTQVTEEISPEEAARLGDDVPGPTFHLLRVFTPTLKT